MTILFQETKDQRVVRFLENIGLRCNQLSNTVKSNLNNEVRVTCIKDGFYDSALLVEANNQKLLNLNDCEVNSQKYARKVKSITGDVDFLLTQFSYAAWKGGVENKTWREEAAIEKLDTMKMQIDTFNPQCIIPFASFIYFSQHDNMHLNDSANTPQKVLKNLQSYSKKIAFLKPFDILNLDNYPSSNEIAVPYWEKKYSEALENVKSDYRSCDLDMLQDLFTSYHSRIWKTNSLAFANLVQKFSPVKAFESVRFDLYDISKVVEIDVVSGKFEESNGTPDIKIHSENLSFLFKNTFGFDTLTVNGCFEVNNQNSFSKFARSFAIENLNNLGIKFDFMIIFNREILLLFFEKLSKVNQKIRGSV